MTIRDFINQNRAELNKSINRAVYRYDGNGGKGTIPNPAPTYSDDQIRKNILGDEGLYNWARAEGCEI